MYATIQPIMFVVLFVYVFGGAIKRLASDYKQYLLPGIFAQTVLFNSSFTAVGLADDLTKGIIDRLRSLPCQGGAGRANVLRRGSQPAHVHSDAWRGLDAGRLPDRGHHGPSG